MNTWTTLTEGPFELAHDFVEFRDNMNRKAGSFLGMFRKIHY